MKEKTILIALLVIVAVGFTYALHLSAQYGERQQCVDWSQSIQSGQTDFTAFAHWQVLQCETLKIPLR